MKKKSLSLIKSIAPAACLFGASAGVIFGISAGLFKISYINLSDSAIRVACANAYNYYNQDIRSEWYMDETKQPQPTSPDIDETTWQRLHGEKIPMFYTPGESDPLKWETPKGTAVDEGTAEARGEFISLVIDGAQHAARDKSFNESVFQGLVNFRHNVSMPSISARDEELIVRKPAQDTNQAFQDQYREIVKTGKTRVLGLPGFPHVAPLQGMGTYDETSGLFKYIDGPDSMINGACIILIDGDIPNNQNVATVLFRADEPAFMTALATCEYFFHNLEAYHAGYHDLSVGTYGGTPLPTVTIYMGGFQRGLEFFNEFVLKSMLKDLRAVLNGGTPSGQGEEYIDIMKYSKYKSELEEWSQIGSDRQNELIAEDGAGLLYDEYNVKMVQLAGFDTYFTGSFAAGDAIGITKQLLNRGVSAILPVSGAQTVDTTQEVANQKTKCFVVGVDTAQENGDSQRESAYSDKTVAPDGSTSDQKNKVVRFSGIKDMVTVTEEITRLCMLNKNWNDKSISAPSGKGVIPDPEQAICNIGYKTCGNIRNGLVSISFDGLFFLMSALRHTNGSLPNLGKMSFEDAWEKTAKLYYTNHGNEIIEPADDKGEDGAFLRNITNWGDTSKIIKPYDTGLLTFKKTYGEGGEIKANILQGNYPHVMNILGELLHTYRMEFNENITIKFPEEPKEWDPFNPVIEKATEPQGGTILDWLKYNMYFIV